MLTRALAVVAMLCAVTLPAVEAVLAASASSVGLCSHDAGRCQRSCPLKRAAAHNCHPAKAPASCSMSSRCSHEAPVVVASGPEFLPSVTIGSEPFASFSPLPGARPPLTTAGHARIDPEPPRRSL